MRIMIRTMCCVVAFAVLASLCGAAEPGFILAHKTLHIGPDMNGAHRFALKGAIQGTQGAGTIVIDKNCCDLNEFGDRTKCTLLACEPIDVKFDRLRLMDPAGQGREVYAIKGKDLPKSFKATLVIGRKCKPFVLRLVVEMGGRQSAFPLVPDKEYDVATTEKQTPIKLSKQPSRQTAQTTRIRPATKEERLEDHQIFMINSTDYVIRKFQSRPGGSVVTLRDPIGRTCSSSDYDHCFDRGHYELMFIHNCPGWIELKVWITDSGGNSHTTTWDRFDLDCDYDGVVLQMVD